IRNPSMFKKLFEMNHSTPKMFIFLTLFGLLFTFTASAQRPPIEGRWNLTIDQKRTPVPSWLEVRHSGYHTMVGRLVGSGGRARPVSPAVVNENNFLFSIPPQWEKGSDIIVAGKIIGERISGTSVAAKGEVYSWTGQRAPKMKRSRAPEWRQPF